jgi:hypothetical protein
MAYKPARKGFGLAVGLVFALLWLAFVWPTPWREYKSASRNMRVNRLTGKTETLSSYGWEVNRQSNWKAPVPTYGGVQVNMPKLRTALEAAGPVAEVCISNINRALRYGKYADALAALDRLGQIPGLTDAQQEAVNEVTEQVKQAAKSQEAAKP